MNALSRFAAVDRPVSGGVPASETALLGMPQLSAAGLSESWLLKELGHRHWMMLATAAGTDVPDFRDEGGQPVYAAFCAVRIDAARWHLARENGRLGMSSVLSRLSRTQMLSRHDLVLDGRAAGTVEMISVFVTRTGDSNHSIARVPIDGLRPIDAAGADLAHIAAGLRRRRIDRHRGFDLPGGIAEAVFQFDPCPAQDFNGAGFLYFTSFLAFVDRSEWRLDRSQPGSARQREAYFYGNLDPGEGLEVALKADHREDRSRWWQVRRSGGGPVLADVFTTNR